VVRRLSCGSLGSGVGEAEMLGIGGG